MHCLISFVALSVLLCTVGVEGNGPCRVQFFGIPQQLFGATTHQCTSNGYFKVIQTHRTTGFSWCVNPETGEKARNSEVKPGREGPPKCGQCFHALEIFYGAGSVLGHILGRNKPQCDADGLFTLVQRDRSSGYSWCVDPKTGAKIKGTDVAPGAGSAKCGGAVPDSKKPAVGKCAQESEKLTPGLIGQYKPQCTSTGNYELIQSHSSTGYSWCVNAKTGQKIEGTQVRGKPTCPTCIDQLSQSLEHAFLDELHNDQCEDDGKFSSVQTDKKGYTWCVDRETGVHIPKSQVPDSVDKKKCTNEPSGPCAQATAYVSFVDLGEFVPKCDGKGFYESIQFNEGHRFCVDTNTGVQVGPKFGPGNDEKLPCEN